MYDANSASPAFARVFKEMILITDPSKPLPRSGKNTVIRKQAIILYSDEIKRLYDFVALFEFTKLTMSSSYVSVKESTNASSVPVPTSWNAEDLQAWLQNEACMVVGRHTLDSGTSLFDQGFDRYGTLLP